MNSSDYQTTVLAALLHDLDALFGLKQSDLMGSAVESSTLEILETARALATSPGEHGDALADVPLDSIFAFLARSDFSKESPELRGPVTPLHFPFTPLAATTTNSFDFIFPASAPVSNRTAYLKQFRTAFDAVWLSTQDAAFDVRLMHLTALLHRFGWCLPSHSSDVSLYDQARLTAAVAACLARLDGQTVRAAPLLLAVGDLSGIQKYIFDIAAVGAGGAARRLRARSFSLGLLSDVASHALAHAFDVPLVNILMSSGGRFFVLLPNYKDAEARLTKFQTRVDEALFTRYNAEIGLNLAAEELMGAQLSASRAGIKGFGAFLGHLNRKLAVAKMQRSSLILQNESGWDTTRFVIPQNFEGFPVCVSCGKFRGDQADGLCKECAAQSRLGSKLTQARFVAFYKGTAPARSDFDFLGEYYAKVLRPDDALDSSGAPYLVVQLNDPDITALTDYPATFRYLANHVPNTVDGTPRSFDEIAGRAETRVSDDELQGRKLLGYLKGDGDRLGTLFAEGLRRPGDGESRDSAAHILAFSRELDLLFSGWLEHTLTKKFRDTYTVFSGGDDLFVLGPWNRALNLAQEVNTQFRRFTCHNPAVTFSAGILFTKPRYPISRAARDADIELEKSKHAGRDRLTILGETLLWEDAPRITREINRLGKFGDDALRSSFLYRLIEYSEMYQRAKDVKTADAARYKSHFAYTIARNLRDAPLALRDWAYALFDELFEKKASPTMEHLGLISTIVLFTRRTRRKE